MRRMTTRRLLTTKEDAESNGSHCSTAAHSPVDPTVTNAETVHGSPRSPSVVPISEDKEHPESDAIKAKPAESTVHPPPIDPFGALPPRDINTLSSTEVRVDRSDDSHDAIANRENGDAPSYGGSDDFPSAHKDHLVSPVHERIPEPVQLNDAKISNHTNQGSFPPFELTRKLLAEDEDECDEDLPEPSAIDTSESDSESNSESSNPCSDFVTSDGDSDLEVDKKREAFAVFSRGNSQLDQVSAHPPFGLGTRRSRRELRNRHTTSSSADCLGVATEAVPDIGIADRVIRSPGAKRVKAGALLFRDQNPQQNESSAETHLNLPTERKMAPQSPTSGKTRPSALDPWEEAQPDIIEAHKIEAPTNPVISATAEEYNAKMRQLDSPPNPLNYPRSYNICNPRFAGDAPWREKSASEFSRGSHSSYNGASFGSGSDRGSDDVRSPRDLDSGLFFPNADDSLHPGNVSTLGALGPGSEIIKSKEDRRDFNPYDLGIDEVLVGCDSDVRMATPAVGDQSCARASSTLRHNTSANCAELCYAAEEGLPPALQENEVDLIFKPSEFKMVGPDGHPKIYSDTKIVGGVLAYRLMVFPLGSQITKNSSPYRNFAAFIEVLDPPNFDGTSWLFYDTPYTITAINWHDWRQSRFKAESWSFTNNASDRGWHDVLTPDDLARGGWLNSRGQIHVRGGIFLRHPETIRRGAPVANSRAETGRVGLKNQGATCYMNALLQSMYALGGFRRAVYMMTYDEDEKLRKSGQLRAIPEDPDDSTGEWSDETIQKALESTSDSSKEISLPYALQHLFYKMDFADEACSCKDLIRSFGWHAADAFTQHDAQELNRLLCDKLEIQMKGTPSEGAISRLFEGEYEMCIQCIDVDYASQPRRETFHDIQLDCADISSLEESLKLYVKAERLDGENMYEAEGHGKVVAEKITRFNRFPPILQFHLKRFQFNLQKMDMEKVNTTFTYPFRLDLDAYLPGAGIYILHAVVVHQGDVHSGHYYAFVRDAMKDRWLKFDDEKVSYVSQFAAIDDNFGGPNIELVDYLRSGKLHTKNPQAQGWLDATGPFQMSSNSQLMTYGGRLSLSRDKLYSAYMLYYVKEDKASELLSECVPAEVNAGMAARLEREVALMRTRDKIRQDLQNWIKIRIVTEKSLLGHSGAWGNLRDLPVVTVLKKASNTRMSDFLIEMQEQVRTGSIPHVVVPPNGQLGLWYFDCIRAGQEIRLWPVDMYEERRGDIRYTTLADHKTWMIYGKDRHDPYLYVLVHYFRHWNRPDPPRSQRKLSGTSLNSALLEAKLVPLKLFDPYPDKLEAQQVYFVGFAQNVRRCTTPVLAATALSGLHLCIKNGLQKFSHPDPQMHGQLDKLWSEPQTEATTCVTGWDLYLEFGSNFSPLSDAKIREIWEDARPMAMPIIVMSWPMSGSPVLDNLLQRRRMVERYGIDYPDVYDEDTEVSEPIAPSLSQLDLTRSVSVRSCLTAESLTPTHCDSTFDPPEANSQARLHSSDGPYDPILAFTGEPTPLRRPPSRHPPKMPVIAPCDPHTWALALRNGSTRVTLRLYDPLQALSQWENSSGEPLTLHGEPVETAARRLNSSSLPSFPTLTPESNSASRLSRTQPIRASGEESPLILQEPQLTEKVNGQDFSEETAKPGPFAVDNAKAATCGGGISALPTTSGPFEELSSSENYGHLASRPLKSIHCDVDRRWPFQLAFRWMAWHLGQHEDYLLLLENAPTLPGSEIAYSMANPLLQNVPVDSISKLAPQVATRGVATRSATQQTAAIKTQMARLAALFDSHDGSPGFGLSTHSLTASPSVGPLNKDESQNSPSSTLTSSSKVLHFCLLPRTASQLIRTAAEPANIGNQSPAFESRLPGPFPSPAHLSSVFIRLFNSRVEVVGAVLVDVPQNGTVKDLLEAARVMITKKMVQRGINRSDTFQLASGNSEAYQIFPPNTRVNDLLETKATNPLHKWYRMESVTQTENTVAESENSVVTVLHATRDNLFFGHPFQIPLRSGDNLAALKCRMEGKLNLFGCSGFTKWRFYQYKSYSGQRSFLRDDSLVDGLFSGVGCCLLAEHPHPYIKCPQRRRNLVLHIG